MMLIVQIILTIVAWNKGWKAYSLIPVGAAFFVGFVIGASGGEIGPTAMAVDALSILALIIMIFNKRNVGN